MSIYDLLFKKDLGKWTVEFNKYKKAIKIVSNLIDIEEKKYGEYYPKKENLFKVFELTPLEKVKVVIVAEAPYPNSSANGLAFSVNKGENIPYNLKNIFTEIKNDYNMFEEPSHGDLTYLAEQGVLLLNQSLTYCSLEPNCYINLWIQFTSIVVNIINSNVDNCIYLLLGKKSEKLNEIIKSREIIIGSNPVGRPFFHKKYFLKINIILRKQNKSQINFNEDKNLIPTYLENIKK